MNERMTTEQYAQSRANETGCIYDVWQLPGDKARACGYRCRLNTRTYTECGMVRVASFKPERKP